MKRLLSILLVVVMILTLSACMATGENGEASTQETWISMLLLVGFVAILYFVMIRPQRKKEKKAKEMIGSMEVGDGVTTIGGIVGRIVSIKEDTVLVETGSDRTKMRFQKWAIQEVEKLSLDD